MAKKIDQRGWQYAALKELVPLFEQWRIAYRLTKMFRDAGDWTKAKQAFMRAEKLAARIEKSASAARRLGRPKQ